MGVLGQRLSSVKYKPEFMCASLKFLSEKRAQLGLLGGDKVFNDFSKEVKIVTSSFF